MFRKSLKPILSFKKDNLLWISGIVEKVCFLTFGVYLLIDHLVADDEFMPISITTLTAFKSALNLMITLVLLS